MTPLQVIIVDDEPLARQRLRTLLARLADRQPCAILAEAGSADELLALPALDACQLLLLDISLPGMDGLALADALRARAVAAELVFITAHDSHALRAFELDARDYLLKPVALERLAETLARVASRWHKATPLVPSAAPPAPPPAAPRRLRVQQRGRVHLVAVEEIVYLRAEQKVLRLLSRSGESLFEGSLAQIERDYPGVFLRIHRKCLVGRSAVVALERRPDGAGEGRWWIRLEGVDAPLAVSRRQLAAVRGVLVSREVAGADTAATGVPAPAGWSQ